MRDIIYWEKILEKCQKEIRRIEKTLEFPFEKVFQTSIWDDTLYRVNIF